MKRTQILDALNAVTPCESIRLCGWVRTRRDAKGFSFLELNDGSCLGNLQVIVDEGTEAYAAVSEATTGASVEVFGQLVPSPGKGQKWEVRAAAMQVLGKADPETFPLQKKRHSDEFLRTIAHLRPRTNKFGSAFRIRSEANYAIHTFFRQNGFFNVHTPILTGSDCEGAGEMFRVTTLPVEQPAVPMENSIFARDFFGRECGLTVSGQLEAEILAQSLGKVYTFGPTFRAENSNTPRHAAEFWMVEPEMAFANLEDDMQLAEDMVRYVTKHVMTHCAADLELFCKFVDKALQERLDTILNQPFGRVSYTEAIGILQASGKGFEYPVEWGTDLQAEHERYLAEEYFKRPVFVYDYPKDIKAFYMRLNDDGKTVAAMDLLAPQIGELVGGSQREERLDILRARIGELGRQAEDYWWYLELREFGSTPHAGFGMGFERMLMLLTGISNIRDVIPFPRTPRHLEF